jgi:hypothetical protein
MTIVTKPARQPPPRVHRYAAKVFADLAQKTKFVDPGLAASWSAIVGGEFASLCRPGRLSGGRAGRTLELIARNGPAAARIQFEAEAIRGLVNTHLGPGTVGHISVRQSAARPSDVRLVGALARFKASIREKKGD